MIAPVEPVVLEKGQNHRMIQTTHTFIDENGQRIVEHGNYIEIQNGLYRLENGQWTESQEFIEPCPRGAVARHGPYKVVFNWNLNSAGAIDIELPDK